MNFYVRQHSFYTRDSIFKLLKSPGIDVNSLCSLAGWYENPIPTRFLAPIDYSKIPAVAQIYRRESRLKRDLAILVSSM
jgi:hypothetical protein